MYHEGGLIYVYLIYGMYLMLNFVTSTPEHPQAVLIRGIDGFDGPGKLAKALQIDRSFYGEDLSSSNRIWVKNNSDEITIKTAPRIGIDYAGYEWASKPWRFILNDQ